MSRKFQIKAVPSTWLESNGRRLDCGPYLSGAIEARELLKKHRTSPLKDLTAGYNGGIFNGPRFPRIYVEDAAHGVPFLGSTDILSAELSGLAFLSNKQVRSNQALLIDEGWTLITCSGTIGRMAFSRADMKNMAGSQHFMRVVADRKKTWPGYLYAYLRSRFGLPLVVSGTYGSIIQSIEPHHIADLPVPRLASIEEEAHELIQSAADLRTQANREISDQVNVLEEEIAGGPAVWEHEQPQSFTVETKSINGFLGRLDAFHHVGFVGEAEKKARVPLIEIAQIADVLRPPIFKRIRVREGGYEFLGGADVMTMDQSSEDQISANTKNIDKFIVKPGQILFQCVGQRYGIFGRPTLANRNLIGKAVSEHQMRIIPHDKKDAGYIFVYLATGFGLRFLLKNSSGTSIPVLQEDGARKIKIYWPSPEKRREIGSLAEAAWEKRARAVELEREAIARVEHAIEAGGH
jgi:type I restriction enzyme S subunit